MFILRWGCGCALTITALLKMSHDCSTHVRLVFKYNLYFHNTARIYIWRGTDERNFLLYIEREEKFLLDHSLKRGLFDDLSRH